MTVMIPPIGEEPVPLQDIDIDEAEVEPGLYVDSFRTRKLLRNSGWEWVVYDGPLPACFLDDDGEPVEDAPTLIQPYSPTAYRVSTAARRRSTLVDPRDINSDYLTGEALLLALQTEDDVKFGVPYWVKHQTGALVRRLTEQGKLHELELNHNNTGTCWSMPVRCQWIKSDGVRCWHWSANQKHGKPYCRTHAGRSVEANILNRTVASARERVILNAPHAVDVLEELMDSASSEPVRLKASTEILDRAGVRGGIEIDASVTVEQVDPAAMVRERLERLAGRLAEAAASAPPLGVEERPELEPVGGSSGPVVEGEVVDDEQR